MTQIKFLYGQNLASANAAVVPGAMYIDTATKELWFDDPSNVIKTHTKIIDTDTLLYTPEGDIIDCDVSANLQLGELTTRDGKMFAPKTLIENVYGRDGQDYHTIMTDFLTDNYMPLMGGVFKYKYNKQTYNVGSLNTTVVDASASTPYHTTTLALGNGGMAGLHSGKSQGKLLLHSQGYSSITLMAENYSSGGANANLYLPYSDGATLATEAYVDAAVANAGGGGGTAGNNCFLNTGGNFYYYDTINSNNIIAGSLIISMSGDSPLGGTSILTLGNDGIPAIDWGYASGKIRLYGSANGYIELSPASATSNCTLTLPATTGTLATQSYVDTAIAGINTTDEKVKQSTSTSNTNRPVMFATSTSNTSGNSYGLNYNSKVTINPYSGTLTASVLSFGALNTWSTAGGTSKGPGSSGQVITSNGTSTYWGTVDTAKNSFDTLYGLSAGSTSKTLSISTALQANRSYLCVVTYSSSTSASNVTGNTLFHIYHNGSGFSAHPLMSTSTSISASMSVTVASAQTTFTLTVSGVTCNYINLYIL